MMKSRVLSLTVVLAAGLWGQAGPVGGVRVSGVVSGLAWGQDLPAPGDSAAHVDLSNAMILLSRTTGAVQFQAQVGAYNIPILGAPYVTTAKTVRDLFGPVPVAYVKLPLGAHLSLEAGILPSLIGAESTFSFQNQNLERGLLWNQENDVNRGLQLDAAGGGWQASVSWNDGYFSSRYSWISAALTRTLSGSQSVTVSGGGNWSHTAFRTLATPVENNSRLLDLVYNLTGGRWTLQPYMQWTQVPANPAAGVRQGAGTWGAAALGKSKLGRGWSVAVRWEAIRAGGAGHPDAVNLLYGPGSGAWSWTVTPGWQRQHYFARLEASEVLVDRMAPGGGFGRQGKGRRQARILVEAGIEF